MHFGNRHGASFLLELHEHGFKRRFVTLLDGSVLVYSLGLFAAAMHRRAVLPHMACRLTRKRDRAGHVASGQGGVGLLFQTPVIHALVDLSSLEMGVYGGCNHLARPLDLHLTRGSSVELTGFVA